jgi:transcriptional regulator with XRE-family HTH domain
VDSGDGSISLARFVRGRRALAGLTQEELAGRTGLSVRSIRNIEAAKVSRPFNKSLNLLATALGLSADERAQLVQAACRDELALDGPSAPGGPEELRPFPRPAQLPPAPSHFAGRRAELAVLMEQAAGPAGCGTQDETIQPAVVAVFGLGGIGKTTLVNQAAQQLARAFPDGQLCAELGGHTPVDPTLVLRRFLADLGYSAADLAGGTDQLVSRYRSALATRRMIIVLDNASHPQQVRPLLPGGTASVVFLTSRRMMHELNAIHAVHLDVLGEPDSQELFESIVGPDRSRAEAGATARVLAACGGLPAAIGLAAARLASRVHWRIGDLADRMADPKQILDQLTVGDHGIRGIFAVSYAALSRRSRSGGASAAEAFCTLCAQLGAHFTLDAAARVLQSPAAEAELLLEYLADRCLVASDGGGRYSIHPLLRLYGQERAVAQRPHPARLARVTHVPRPAAPRTPVARPAS